MAVDPPADLPITTVDGEERPLREWLTNFHLALVCIDPYTVESSVILDTARRVMRVFSGAAARMCWLVTADAPDTRRFLGPLATEFFTLIDPQRDVVKALGLERLPAFVIVRADATVLAAAEGWHPAEWKAVCGRLAELTAWTRPDLPHPKDPRPFAGSPAIG